jgi:hypothetical protein
MEELYVAHLSTANYDFYLVADTEETMWLEMERSWEAHAEKVKGYPTYSTDNSIYTWNEVKDSVWWILQPINLVWKR